MLDGADVEKKQDEVKEELQPEIVVTGVQADRINQLAADRAKNKRGSRRKSRDESVN